jgi:hypothetical protein
VILRPKTLIPELVLLCCLATGCGDSRPKTPAQGSYGQIKAQPSANIARAQPPASAELAPPEGSIVLKCLQTELSPATLFQTASDQISFFSEMEKFGLGGPTHVAFTGMSGPRAFKVGERLEPHMEENWVLVWFAGARGWTNGDSPSVIYLQHKPKVMRLDENGLHFEFRGAAGDIVLLPLYGSYRTPAEGRGSRTQFSGKPVKTWEWAKVLPREPLMHLRYWASALREFPTYCEETFSVDRSTDSVTIRQKMQWHSIDDEWRTKHLKLNPVSPPLGLASKSPAPAGFPAKFSRVVMDLVMPTPCGPYMAAEGETPLDVTFSILQYVNERAETTNYASTGRGEVGTWARWEVDEAAHYITTAREAYRGGDIDRYNYECYLFARAFTQEWFARAAPEYFAKYELPNAVSPRTQLGTNAQARERLIPSGEPSPFVFGIEREVSGPHAQLLQEVRTQEGEWPLVMLRRGEREEWPMGRVKAGANRAPRKVVRGWHSRNTEKIVLLN